MASRALTARFIMTWSICPASARTAQRFGLATITRSMSSPIMRVSIFRFSVATSFRLTMRGASICLRLKARSWRVSDEARSAALAISCAGPRRCGSAPEAFEQELRVAGDHHQQVVEVMRNAAGQAAHRFHLLRLAQLLLERAPFGNVLGEQLEHHAFTVAVSDGRPETRTPVVVPFFRFHSAVSPLNGAARRAGSRRGRTTGRCRHRARRCAGR